MEHFNCRDNTVTLYFKEQGRNREKKNLTRTTVFLTDDMSEVTGFYSLYVATVKLAKSKRKSEEWKNIIYSPSEVEYPAVKIHFLGRNEREEYKGYGADILIHSLKKCNEIAELVGVSLIILECKSVLKSYYESFDFTCIGSTPAGRKVMAMKTTNLKVFVGCCRRQNNRIIIYKPRLILWYSIPPIFASFFHPFNTIFNFLSKNETNPAYCHNSLTNKMASIKSMSSIRNIFLYNCFIHNKQMEGISPEEGS